MVKVAALRVLRRLLPLLSSAAIMNQLRVALGESQPPSFLEHCLKTIQTLCFAWRPTEQRFLLSFLWHVPPSDIFLSCRLGAEEEIRCIRRSTVRCWELNI